MYNIGSNILFILSIIIFFQKRCEQSGRTVIGPDPRLRLGQIALPKDMASNLTYPEIVNIYNMSKLQQLVYKGKVNYVTRKNGNKDICGTDLKTKINMKYATRRKGTTLLYGDVIRRQQWGEEGGPNWIELKVTNGNIELEKGDQIIRGGNILTGVIYPEDKNFVLQIGDKVDRQLRNGDTVLFNRQPTLHRLITTSFMLFAI